MRAFHLPVALMTLVLASCTGSTDGPGEARLVELDSKSDAELMLDVDAMDIFRFDCDLSSCRYRLDVGGLPPGQLAWVAIGDYEEVEAHRESVLGAADPKIVTTPDVAIIETTVDDDGFATFVFDVGERSHYGAVYLEVDADASGARLRLLPDLEGATQVPQEDVGVWRVRSAVEAGEVHRWRVSVEDVLNFFDPTVDVVLQGNSLDLDLVMHYQCTSDGTTFPIEISLGRISQSATFTPDCPTTDDGGAIYMEVTGDTSYTLAVSVTE